MGRWLGYGLTLLLAGCGVARSGLMRHATHAATPPAPAVPVASVTDLPANSPLLSSQDLAPGPNAVPPPAAHRRAAAAQTGLLGSVPGHADDDACLAGALSRLTVHASGDTAVVSGRLDLGACLAATLGGPDAEVLSATETLRFYLRISCDGADLGRFDGHQYGDLVAGDAHPCANARGAGVLAQTDDVQLARVRRHTPTGYVTAEEGRRHVQAQGGRGGGVCRYELQGGRFVRGQCVTVSRELVTRSRTERDGQVVTRPEEGYETYARQVDGASPRPL